MIQPNWEVFSAKFSTNKESTFEWFTYLLFCREFNLSKGWFGFKNQSGIEKNPIEQDDEVIGFQAKFYSTSLSDHKKDFLEMLDKAKRDYPKLTKILIYTNQMWGQAFCKKEEKMTSPQALVDIENKANELNILLEWREASFFESEFVTLEHDDLSKYFFTEEPLQGWQRFDDWSNTKASIEEAYFVDNDIKVVTPQNRNNSELNVVDGINAIRNKLSHAGTSVRFVGLSGVGKTRFAQALFDERIGENNLDVRSVWYCDIGDSPNPLPEHFIEELKLKNKPYILIIDNCGQDTHANLTKKIQNTEISLLTIEYDVKDDLPERTDVYKLQPNSTDIIKKVIERHYTDINDINIRKIAEFSGGNYRLALAIASNIEKNDNLALLTDNQLFERLFWQKGQKNDELFKIAQNFALVYSFNIEDSDDENSELDFLAKFAKVDSDTAIEAIETLKSKDIIQQRGKWRAILPHALANHLAKELISKKLVNRLDQLTQLMPERLQRSFIKRLSYLHDLQKVQELVTLWFSDEGLLGKKFLEGTYDDQDLVKIRLLSHISEEQLLNLLEKKHHLDPMFLTRENPSFIEISHLLRILAYTEHNFEKAFNLLVYFAKDEKENERNNSIMDLLTSLFRLRRSETLANLELKKEVLTSLHSNRDYLSILLACLSKALNFHQYGFFIRESNESGKSTNYGYQPETYSEICSWTEFLLGILNELDKKNILQARKIFVANLKDIIWTCGKVDFVKLFLKEFSERSYFSEAYNKILIILKYNEDKLKVDAPKLLSDLKDLEQSLRPTKDNLTELIKSYILVFDHNLHRITEKNNDEYSINIPDFDSYECLINHIGNELKNIDKLIKNLDLLIKANTVGVGKNYLVDFGKASSSIFIDVNQCINALVDIKIDKKMHSSEFILGLLVGFKNNSLDDFYSLIEFMGQNDNFKHTICLLLIQSCNNDNDFKYFSQLIVDNRIEVLNFPRLSANKKYNYITNDQFEVLIDALISVGAIDQVRDELLNECYFQKCVSDKYKEILLSYSYEFMSNDDSYNHFEYAVNFLLKSDNSTNDVIFKNVQKFFNTERYVSFHREDKKFKLLKLLLKNDTKKFINYFIEDEKFLKKFWNDDLAKVLIYANSHDVLSWINHDPKKINFWVENVRLFKIESVNQDLHENPKSIVIWQELLLDLLEQSTDREGLLNLLFESSIFRVRSAIGSWSEAMGRRLPSIKSLKKKIEPLYPELLALINTKEKEWLTRIEEQAKIDDEKEKQRSERFEW